MRMSGLVRRLLPLVVVLCVPLAVTGQERVAQIKTVEGNVTVTRAADGTVDEARQVGPRVRSGSVFGGDVVSTDAQSAATLVFTDGSQVKLKESTRLSVREVDFSALVAAGQSEKPMGRVIKVLAGEVWSNVAPNPDVATQFETPSGVAAVKGTSLTITVGEE